jgi:predicted secreted protein
MASNEIEFRDFQTGASYRAALIQTIEGSGTSLRSSFLINLDRTTRDGTKRSYVVGTPQLRRPLIASYRIRQVMVHGDSMILVIEMVRQEGENSAIRYMVEALRL